MANAVIQHGLVVNIIEGGSPGMETVPDDGTAQIGGTWDGQSFHPAPVVVPQSVTRRQAKQALLLAGKLSSVQPAIDAITDPTQKGLMQIEWDESLDFIRSRPALIQLGYAIGLTDADIDNLFIKAATL